MTYARSNMDYNSGSPVLEEGEILDDDSNSNQIIDNVPARKYSFLCFSSVFISFIERFKSVFFFFFFC